LTCELPATVVVEVTYAEPGIKGDTATNTLRPMHGIKQEAKSDDSLCFINIGDKNKSKTLITGDYMERVK
jgi:elongation factor P